MNVSHRYVSKSKIVSQRNVGKESSNTANVGEKLFRLTSESAGSIH